MAYEEEVEHIIKYASIEVGIGAVESTGVKVKHPEVLVEVFNDRESFTGVDRSSEDKM